MTFTIQDYLGSLHQGSWFHFQGLEHTHANLRVEASYGYAKPTKAVINAGIQAMQDAYDAKDYARNRAAAYPSIGDQLDMQYHDLLDSTTTWKDAVKAVKDLHPKP